ncbi:MAG: four helix bundle protein [Acidobacteria bacterium]|nr:four helix bundle protein [Acidobacteriota bacterium]MBK9528634.1 four helix bundle protein [Acidobacteriota bacterium]MBP7476359.1 four helix bundle protein [Pyrinomonadaceae bacterium]
MKGNVLLDKSFDFSVRIVNVYKVLAAEKREYVLSKQLLRSGTSIGANAEEAVGGQSRADFLSKLSIAYKEARETKYWIRLLERTEYLSTKEAQSLLADLDELLRIIGKIQITTRSNS